MGDDVLPSPNNESLEGVNFKDDWIVKRIRSRLLGYRLYLRGLSQQIRQDRNKLARDPEARESAGAKVDARRASWKIVANNIINHPSVSHLVPESEDVAIDQNGDPIADLSGDEDDDLKSILPENRLLQFVEGYQKKRVTGETFIHYTKPERFILQIIAVFLLAEGFISRVDLVSPFPDTMPDELQSKFKEFGLKAEWIPQDRYFRGDYANRIEGHSGAISRYASFQTDKSATVYRVRLIDLNTTQQTNESTDSFTSRIQKQETNLNLVLIGWAFFSERQPFVIGFVERELLRPGWTYMFVSDVIRGPGIDPVVKLQGAKKKAPNKDIADKLAMQIERFALIFLEQNRDIAAWNIHPIKFHDSNIELNSPFDGLNKDKNSCVFSIDYDNIVDKAENNNLQIKNVKNERKPRRGVLRFAPETEEDTDMEEKTNEEKLIEASSIGDSGMIAQLKKEGVDINYATPDYKATALHFAASRSPKHALPEIMSTPGLNHLAQDWLGRLPSSLAMEVGDDPETAQLLMEAEVAQAKKEGKDYKELLRSTKPMPLTFRPEEL